METKYHLPARYDVTEPLGEGGTGHVYKVFDSETGKKLALKILSETDPGAYTTLKKEFEILSRLNHDNLVRVHNFGFTPDNIPYFTMDLIEGHDLRAFLEKDGNIIRLTEILDSIFSALHYLHNKKILHRDIKPENVMISISSSGEIKTTLMDFGMAIKGTHRQNIISGTPRYLSPEILSELKYSIASDFYALGITIIDCLVDINIPISTKITESFLKNAYSGLNKCLASAGIKSPSSFSSFLLSLCSLDSGQRPESASDCLQFLSRLYKTNDTRPGLPQSNMFVGRENELDLIDAFLESDNTEENTLLLLGQTGIGKKSLMEQAVIDAQLKGFTTIDLANRSFDNNSFNQFIETLGTHLPEKSRKKLLKNHNRILETFSRHQNDGISSTTQDKTPVIFDNIIQFLHKLSIEHPILICIPDILRFSTDFIRFIDHMIYETGILESNARIIISRNIDISIPKIKADSLKSITSSKNVCSIDIPPFGIEELSYLLKEQFEDVLFSEEELLDIINQSGGIPLYIHSILKHLIVSSIIFQDGNNWNLDRKLFSRFEIPESFAELARYAFDDYDRVQRTILQAIAIWHIPINISDLSFLMNMSNDKILFNITPLINSGIIIINDDYIDFSNPSYRIQVTKNTPHRKRVKLNQLIANYLTKQEHKDYSRISGHYTAATALSESIEYGLKAAEQLVSRYEYYNAYDLLFNIYTLTRKKGSIHQQISVLDKLVLTEQIIGLVDEASEHYKYLIEHTSISDIRVIYLIDLGRIKDYYFIDSSTALKIFSQALNEAKLLNNRDLVIEIMIMQGYSTDRRNLNILLEAANLAKNRNLNLYALALSKIAYTYKFAGKIGEMEAVMDNLLPIVHKPEIMMNTKNNIFYILYLISFYQGDYDTAKKYLDKMINISHITCNEIGNVSNLSMLGGLYFIRGKNNKLIHILNKAFLLAQRFNMNNFTILILSNLSSAYRILGDYSSALKAIDIVDSKLTKIKYYNIINLLKPFILFISLGDYFKKDYFSYSNILRNSSKKQNNILILGLRKLVISQYHFQKLSFTRALRNASEALVFFRKTADRDDIVDTLAHICVYEVEKGAVKEATAHIKEARKIFDEIHCNYLKPYLLFAEGSLARITQNKNTEKILEEALKSSTKMGTRENTWQIQRQLALYFKGIGNLSKAIIFYRDSIETIKQITESIPKEEIKISYLSLPFRKRVFDEIKALKYSN